MTALDDKVAPLTGALGSLGQAQADSDESRCDRHSIFCSPMKPAGFAVLLSLANEFTAQFRILTGASARGDRVLFGKWSGTEVTTL
jgi:hypothetical protein